MTTNFTDCPTSVSAVNASMKRNQDGLSYIRTMFSASTWQGNIPKACNFYDLHHGSDWELSFEDINCIIPDLPQSMYVYKVFFRNGYGELIGKNKSA
jgi:hypothetical protein